jgi:NADPH-dependent 2,4-dienoyl-CoA reductase/sulfur reductase-like enzyme
MKRIVVVGASLAGISAAEELRHLGFEGEIVLVGDEAHLPYDRPPLSKAVLLGQTEPERCALRSDTWYAELEIELELGAGATALDLDRRVLALANGASLAFDGLVVATGAAPVQIGSRRLRGLHTLRTLDDARSIRASLAAGARCVVVGGGFIGAEVAAAAATLGVPVTMVEALPAPMSRVLGRTIGDLCAQMHSEHGVDVRCGSLVADVLGDEAVSGVALADGTVLEADLVVVGVGVRPSTGWLESSGLEVANGVVCDSRCRTAHPGVVAAGDVARWLHPRLGEIRIEHWENAARQGQAAAATLVHGEDAPVYDPVPYVWSDQYDRKIQMVGIPADGDELLVVDGSLAERKFVALFGRDGRLTAGLSFNRSKPIRQVRELLARGTCSLDEAAASFDGRRVATSE